MPRKPNTVHVQIAQEYRAWLRDNPDTKRRQKFAAFNRIADNHLREVERLKKMVA